jgi:hypothetical protein
MSNILNLTIFLTEILPLTGILSCIYLLYSHYKISSNSFKVENRFEPLFAWFKRFWMRCQGPLSEFSFFDSVPSELRPTFQGLFLRIQHLESQIETLHFEMDQLTKQHKENTKNFEEGLNMMKWDFVQRTSESKDNVKDIQ